MIHCSDSNVEDKKSKQTMKSVKSTHIAVYLSVILSICLIVSSVYRQSQWTEWKTPQSSRKTNEKPIKSLKENNNETDPSIRGRRIEGGEGGERI